MPGFDILIRAGLPSGSTILNGLYGTIDAERSAFTLAPEFQQISPVFTTFDSRGIPVAASNFASFECADEAEMRLAKAQLMHALGENWTNRQYDWLEPVNAVRTMLADEWTKEAVQWRLLQEGMRVWHFPVQFALPMPRLGDKTDGIPEGSLIEAINNRRGGIHDFVVIADAAPVQMGIDFIRTPCGAPLQAEPAGAGAQLRTDWVRYEDATVTAAGSIAVVAPDATQAQTALEIHGRLRKILALSMPHQIIAEAIIQVEEENIEGNASAENARWRNESPRA